MCQRIMWCKRSHVSFSLLSKEICLHMWLNKTICSLTRHRFSGLVESCESVLEYFTKPSGENRLDEAMAAVDMMNQQGMYISRDIIFCILQGCTKKKDLAVGRKLHSLIVCSREDSDTLLEDHLIRLFAWCGSLFEASQAFCKVLNPTVYTWNAIIFAHAKFGEGEKALDLYHKMTQDGLNPDEVTFSCILKACGSIVGKDQGRLIHKLVITHGCESDLVVGNTLINLYVKCGSLEEAQTVFDELPCPDAVSFSAMIGGYAEQGCCIVALELFMKMQQEGIMPDRVTFLCVLKSCGIARYLVKGRFIHDDVMKRGYKLDVIMGSTLVDMYAKCGSLEDACRVFDELPNRNMVSWVAIITGYAMHGFGLRALDLFKQMQDEGIEPNRVTFLLMLSLCSSTGAIQHGMFIHNQTMQKGLDSDLVIGNALVHMYAKCGMIELAYMVIQTSLTLDMSTWEALISGCAQHGNSSHALEWFERMTEIGMNPSRGLFLSIMKACGNDGTTVQGMLIHEKIIGSGIESDVVVGASLVDMYVKCGNLEGALKVFNKMCDWNGVLLEAKKSRSPMKLNVKLWKVMLLKACGRVGATSHGMLVHQQVLRIGLEVDMVVGNVLVDMYCKCWSLKEAQKWFDSLPNKNAVSWGSMIAGYVQHGYCLEALELFHKMQREGFKPSKPIFSCLLKACGMMSAIGVGQLIHDQILKSGLIRDVRLANMLIYMYIRCGNPEEGQRVFDDLLNRDLVSWCLMLEGYAKQGHAVHAFELFKKMQDEGKIPNRVICLCVLKACSNIGAIEQGRLLHREIIRSGFESDMVVGSILVDLYAKCGNIMEACKVFDEMSNQDVMAWGAMISGYLDCGNWMLVKKCFEDMQHKGVKPNDVICTSILTACSRNGLLEDGRQYFKILSEDLQILPRFEHYGCMVDLLGRAGWFEEAKSILQTMPVLPDMVLWISMLTNCRTHGNIQLGRQCFDQLSQSDLHDATSFVLMSSIYANTHRWNDLAGIQMLRKWIGVQKKPGAAWIEANNKVHVFIVGEITHPLMETNSSKSERLDAALKGQGYVPHVDCVSETTLDEDIEDLSLK